MNWYASRYPETAEALRFRTLSDVMNTLTAAPYLIIDGAHLIPDITTIVKVLADANEHLADPYAPLARETLAMFTALRA